ncbi:uncharacterized protein K02A2.6-like [Engraulis encrasicolus]|uniref:uncharacterized protein K02A2.6-like n=1 Tax=Engraulis encrasicolus TaxID=184585 RepID=UPI002FD6A3DC
METLRPPEGLKLVGNVDSNWRSFKQQFELYLSATGMDNKPGPRKIAILLTVAGPQAMEVFNTFEFERADDKEDYGKVIEKFEAYCSPKKNIVYERCAKCNGKNHFAKQCLTKDRSKPVRVVEETDLGETFFIDMVSCENIKKVQATEAHKRHTEDENWIVSLPINGALVALRIDTGAQANLISMTEIRAMKEKPKIFKKSVQLKDYNGKEIESKGQCRLRVTVKNKQYSVLFSIVPEGRESLLGGLTSKNLNLVRRVYQISCSDAVRAHNSTVDSIVQRFPDVFKGLGCLPYTYTIQLKEDAEPVIHAPRRIPAPLRERLKKELDRMCEMNVITKVEEPTEWVNSMVCVDKKNKNKELRICMDPGDLNRNIKREHYQIPKREEIASEMAGAKYFSKLDAAQGFWQIKLDDKSSRYCTFNTPYGRYRFLRMPFGIISASEIYHRAMDNMLEGLEGVRCYIDDVVIWGSTLQEHNERLAKVLHRISDNGLKLNRAKCQFGVQEVTFLGDKLSSEGIEPDERKIQAILSMPRPTDKKGVLRIMGMINFIGKFIPNLSVKTSALRELLHDSTEFKWTTRNEREWNALKATLTKSPVLAYYDPEKRQKISTDASKDGLGAVLLQAEGDSWQPVAYASRSMTKTETKYAQIEKECLGLAYGLEKFHCYVYGLPSFTVETDHRPLVSIIKKNLNEMSPRIQRLIMKLQRYDFELIYTPGKHLVIADTLSRAPVMSEASSTEKDIENHVNMIVQSLPVSDVKTKQVRDELDRDTELQTVMKNMLTGWPRGSCPKYFNIRAELSVANGLLLRDNRLVIPQSLRPEILRQIHEGHLGIEKCKRRARCSVYWPGINQDIENMAGKYIKPNTGIQKKLENMKWKQKQRFDKSTKPLSPLAKDDVVRIQDQDAWNRKATVLQEVGPRSYEVKTEEGHVLRRNRRSLLKTKETFTETEIDADAVSASAASNDDTDGHSQEDTSNVQSELPVLRRSGRQTKRPDRLDL